MPVLPVQTPPVPSRALPGAPAASWSTPPSQRRRAVPPRAPHRRPDRRPGGHPTARGRGVVQGRSVHPSRATLAARANVRAGRRPVVVPVRLTRRGRVVLGSLLCLALSLAAYSVLSVLPGSGAAAGPGGAGQSSRLAPRAVTVVVQPGQTLWQIGRALSPGSDTRDVVARLQRLNHLTDGVLVAGQTLQLR